MGLKTQRAQLQNLRVGLVLNHLTPAAVTSDSKATLMGLFRSSPRHLATSPAKASRDRLRSRGGLTLVEVSISTLIVGLLMVASLQSVANIGRTWTITNQLVDGQGLAQELIREILAQGYSDPTDPNATTWGLETGETTRATFDDLDDYSGWTESPVKNAAGTALAGYTGWTRSVLVQLLNKNDYSVLSAGSVDQGLRAITVTVTSPANKTTIAKVYRSNQGGTLQPLSADATFVTWIGCTLELGTNAPATTGVSLSNHAEDQ